MFEYDPTEQQDIIEAFASMLRLPTADGGRKRQAKAKPPWTVDNSHREAMYRHLKRWETGATYDEDSGGNALIHVAWRALALAWQQDNQDWC